MTFTTISTSLSPLLTFAVISVLFCGMVSTSDLGFHCVFGPMVTTVTPEGQTLEYCPTQMEPPVMTKGDYILAVKDGKCYECMCASDTGLACCDCPRPRRG
uniref:VWFC domain-containing protein n=1 Tax=Arion vulgaris TaxID=1028688 RepID=A0A0B7BZF1_9EUPU